MTIQQGYISNSLYDNLPIQKVRITHIYNPDMHRFLSIQNLSLLYEYYLVIADLYEAGHGTLCSYNPLDGQIWFLNDIKYTVDPSNKLSVSLLKVEDEGVVIYEHILSDKIYMGFNEKFGTMIKYLTSYL